MSKFLFICGLILAVLGIIGGLVTQLVTQSVLSGGAILGLLFWFLAYLTGEPKDQRNTGPAKVRFALWCRRLCRPRRQRLHR